MVVGVCRFLLLSQLVYLSETGRNQVQHSAPTNNIVVCLFPRSCCIDKHPPRFPRGGHESRLFYQRYSPEQYPKRLSSKPYSKPGILDLRHAAEPFARRISANRPKVPLFPADSGNGQALLCFPRRGAVREVSDTKERGRTRRTQVQRSGAGGQVCPHESLTKYREKWLVQ